jgi:putative hydrolase of the HAD superfamily
MIFSSMIRNNKGTLYLESNGYVQHCRSRGGAYLAEKFGWSLVEAEDKRKLALKTSNQTVKGLKTLGYDVNDVEFVTHMREGVENFLKPDEDLSSFLAATKHLKKYIFTNTREVEAEKALKCLGIREHFEHVYGADFMGDMCKPEEAAFQKVIDDIGVAATNCVMFEDSIKNVVAAKAMGMKTIFVRGRDPEQGGDGADGTKVIDCACDCLTVENLKVGADFLF